MLVLSGRLALPLEGLRACTAPLGGEHLQQVCGGCAMVRFLAALDFSCIKSTGSLSRDSEELSTGRGKQHSPTG